VLLGEDPPVELSHRAVSALERLRTERAGHVDPGGTVLRRGSDRDVWWTFAGTKANSSIVGALAAAGIEATSNSEAVTLANAGMEHLRGLAGFLDQGVASTVDRAAVEGLKFSAALPLELAISTLSERGSDDLHARAVIEQPIVVRYE
jgi:ATP-dependent Lhr-like helicase